MKKLLLALWVIVFTSSVLSAQNKNEQAEQLWYQNKAIIDKNIAGTDKVTKMQYKKFLKYNAASIAQYKKDFFKKYVYQALDANGIRDYFGGMGGLLTLSFDNFKTQYATNPGIVDKAIADNKPQRILGTCSPVPVNLDFSSGTLAGWSAYYATNNSNSSFNITGMTGGLCGPVKAACNDALTNTSGALTDYQVTIDSAGNLDPIDSLLPVVPPGAHYSCRIGDSTNPNQGVAIITDQFVLPDSTPVLNCNFAFLLENPNHTFQQQPFMVIAVLDSVGDTIMGYRYVSQSGTLPAIYYPLEFDSVYYQTWKQVSFLLPKYAGHCVTLVYEVADCALGGHFGYAYVSASLSKTAIATTYAAYCGQPNFRLNATALAPVYIWSGPCITGPTNQAYAQVTCGGTYTLVLQDSAHTYSDTTTIIVPTLPGPAPKPSFMADTVCAGMPTSFTNTSVPDSTGVNFYWEFDNSGYGYSNNTNPNWTYYTTGVHYVHLVETVNGCAADTIVPVFDTVCPTSIKEINSSQSINIYPNPSNGVFTIQSSVNSGQSIVEVYNVLGEKIASSYLIPDTRNTINLTFNSAGVYFYRIITEKGSCIASGKLVKE